VSAKRELDSLTLVSLTLTSTSLSLAILFNPGISEG
jgi:hypothetical protein